jgi:hypothetical protein
MKKRKLKRQTQPFIQKANLVESISSIKGFVVEDKDPSAEKRVLRTEGALNRVRPTGEWMVGVSEEYAPIDHSHPIALLVRTHPQPPVNDELRYEGTQLYRWDGTQWIQVSGGSGGGTPPSRLHPLSHPDTPQPNELRFDNDRLFVRVGSSWQRIDGTPPTVLFVRTDTTPPKVNELRFENNLLYRWDGSQWVDMSGTGGSGALTIRYDSRVQEDDTEALGYAEIAHNDLFYVAHEDFANNTLLYPVSHGRYIPANQWAINTTTETFESSYPAHIVGVWDSSFGNVFGNITTIRSVAEQEGFPIPNPNSNSKMFIPVGVFYVPKRCRFKVFVDLLYTKFTVDETQAPAPAIFSAYLIFRHIGFTSLTDANTWIGAQSSTVSYLSPEPTRIYPIIDDPYNRTLRRKRFYATIDLSEEFPRYDDPLLTDLLPVPNLYFVSILLERHRDIERERSSTGGGGGTGGGGTGTGGTGGVGGVGNLSIPRFPPDVGDEETQTAAVGIIDILGAFVHIHAPTNRYPLSEVYNP